MKLQSFRNYSSPDYIPEGYEMRSVPAKTAADLLMKYHYLGRMPRATVVVCAVFEDDDPEPVAAVFFGHPASRWTVPVLELTRLVRSDDCRMSLTQLIAFACKQIKADKSQPQLLISYADPSAGHHGGVYQAASWNFHEKRNDYIDGATVNGKFVPWRTLRHHYGSSSANVVKQKNPDLDIVKHVAEGKYLYWRALDGKAEKDAKAAGLTKNPYPKPGAASAAA